MKPKDYNPSPLEVDFTTAIIQLKDQIQHAIGYIRIEKVEKDMDADNPALRFHISDKDGDKHQVVIRVIQRLPGAFNPGT